MKINCEKPNFFKGACLLNWNLQKKKKKSQQHSDVWDFLSCDVDIPEGYCFVGCDVV